MKFCKRKIICIISKARRFDMHKIEILTSLYQPITLIMEFYYMSNGLSKFLPLLGFDLKMVFAKFQRNRFKIVEEST